MKSGERLGPYEIVSLIGAGGMGQVFKARDTRLNRIVAIKLCDEEFTERFEREARAVAALNHPNICTLYDVGPNYLVMEYIDGAPVKGPLPLRQILEYSRQVCDALEAAHKKGIIHRDLKPANILVTKTGVKLLDFGLAKIESGARDNEATVSLATSGDGAVLGTLLYMSPEQIEGKPADARSDIYSFGLVLYEMATGKRAFPHADLVPLRPPMLERAFRTCVARDPEDRWQAARELKHVLDWVSEAERAAPEPARRELPRWLAPAAAIAAVVLLPVAFWLGRPSNGKEPPQAIRLAVNPPENTVFSGPANASVPAVQLALSPDGRSLVFVAEAAGGMPLLWIRPLKDVAARPMAGTEGAQNPFWSPDSRSVAFFADGKLNRIPAGGGEMQIVAEGISDPRGGTWGPGDTILFGTGPGPVYRVSSNGGTPAPVTKLDAARREGSHRWPQFLPDGKHFLYVVRSGLADQRGLYAGSLDGGTKKLLARIDAYNTIYAPPGYLLFLDGDTVLAQPFDARKLEFSGQAAMIAEVVGHSSIGYGAVTVSNTGTLAYAGPMPRAGDLTWIDRNGAAIGKAGELGEYVDFRLSPDETRLAATLVDLKTGAPDIWLTEVARSNTLRFTFGPTLNASPVWSPDGSRIAFRSTRSGAAEIYENTTGGGGKEEALLSDQVERAQQMQSVNMEPTDWSPDGKHILFSFLTLGSGFDLWLMPHQKGAPPERFFAGPGDQIHGNFSPDGHYVSYTSNESNRFEVYVQSFPKPDRKWKVSVGGGYEPRWRADGRELYYLADDRKVMAVDVRPGPVFGDPKPLFSTRVLPGVNAFRTNYVPARDGRRFLVNMQAGDLAPEPITVVLNWMSAVRQ
jgi:eukaryotic-like serine/threonine-protein kinase